MKKTAMMFLVAAISVVACAADRVYDYDEPDALKTQREYDKPVLVQFSWDGTTNGIVTSVSVPERYVGRPFLHVRFADGREAVSTIVQGDVGDLDSISKDDRPLVCKSEGDALRISYSYLNNGFVRRMVFLGDYDEIRSVRYDWDAGKCIIVRKDGAISEIDVRK